MCGCVTGCVFVALLLGVVISLCKTVSMLHFLKVLLCKGECVCVCVVICCVQKSLSLLIWAYLFVQIISLYFIRP